MILYIRILKAFSDFSISKNYLFEIFDKNVPGF